MKGVFLILVGAICFSVKAIVIKMAYQTQIDPLTLLTLRMGFSLPFFMVVPFVFATKSQTQSIPKSDWIKLIALGILGYYVASIFDFWGLKYITAGLERLILFVYPTLVVIISYFIYKTKIGSTAVWALVSTYFGILIIFSDINLTQNIDIQKGSFFIFVSAFAYAAYLVGSGSLITKMGSILFNSYAMIASCIAVMVHFAIAQPSNIFQLDIQTYSFALFIAIFCTVIPTFLVAEGMRLIGAGKASIIASIGPCATIFLGYIFLNEAITWIEILGTVFVLGGVVMISVNKTATKKT